MDFSPEEVKKTIEFCAADISRDFYLIAENEDQFHNMRKLFCELMEKNSYEEIKKVLENK